MRIIAVDDEESALWALERAIKKSVPDAQLNCFSLAEQALELAAERAVDVAFLDIEMHDINGLQLAKRLKEISPATNIIFVTGYSEYMQPAFEMHASGYVMKPIRPERVERELRNLRYPAEVSNNGVRIQCFGSFAVFVDGKLLAFPQAKAKELLAFLVHKKGAPVSNAEIAAVLWEDRVYDASLQSQTRRVRGQLSKLLKSAGIGDILRKDFNSLAIDTGRVNCDYHEFLKGDVTALNTYAGEYMSEYSWAEFMVAQLNNLVQ